jgi:TRAP-type mannitol/chloroaromatic compound transport system substrate-binding protein
MFVSWGKLDVAQKKFATLEEQAEKSLKAASKSAQTKTMERVKQDSMKINSHKAVYNHVRMEETPKGFFSSKQKILRDVLSIHLHCEPTSRYFVIYAMPTRNAPEDFGDLFLDMAHTFECHPIAR